MNARNIFVLSRLRYMHEISLRHCSFVYWSEKSKFQLYHLSCLSFLSFILLFFSFSQIFDLLPKDKKATRPSGPLPLKEDIRGRPLVRG